VDLAFSNPVHLFRPNSARSIGKSCPSRGSGNARPRRETAPVPRHVAIGWAQRLEPVYGIDEDFVSFKTLVKAQDTAVVSPRCQRNRSQSVISSIAVVA
jgi:hypothetical protein